MGIENDGSYSYDSSDQSYQGLLGWIAYWQEKNGYLTLAPPRLGKDRSITQNNLFQRWARTCAAHYLDKPEKEVTKGEHEGMKRTIKREYYRDTSDKFMVHKVINPKRPSQTKSDYTSSGDWKKPEMYAVLTWLQITASKDGIVLESKGDFLRFTREQNQ